MPSKANQLPKGGKVNTPPPQRNRLPLYLAAGGALLVIIIGVVLLAQPGAARLAPAAPAQVTGQPKLAVDRAAD